MLRLYGLFGLAERASGGYWVRRLGGRDDIKAAQWLDAYVIGWVLLEVAFFVVSPRGLPLLFAIPAVYRLIEVMQVFVNALLFDARRFESRHPDLGSFKVQSGERTVVQYIVLFLEIPFLFGVFYFVLRDHFQSLNSAFDALAYSFGTVTTLGDPSGVMHTAEGGWRFLPLGEVVYGFLVGVIVLGRVISVLPPIGSLDRQTATSGRTEPAEGTQTASGPAPPT